MRGRDLGRQVRAALRKNAAAFSPAGPSSRPGFLSQFARAVSRNTPAFVSRFNARRARAVPPGDEQPAEQPATDGTAATTAARIDVEEAISGIAIEAGSEAGSVESRVASLRAAIETLSSDRRMLGDGDSRFTRDALDGQRIPGMLDLFSIFYLSDGQGALLALWERHAMLFTVEGGTGEILVMRVKPHRTIPPSLRSVAYKVINEWNRDHLFMKAYVGDPDRHGQLPVYAEMQLPMASGIADTLLFELLDTGISVAAAFVGWLHDEERLFSR